MVTPSGSCPAGSPAAAALGVVMGALPYAAVAFIATANVVALPLAGVFAVVFLSVGGKAFVAWIRRLTGREIARGVLLGLLFVAGLVFLITRK